METVNFAFMKFFNSLVKITFFWVFLLFLGDSCHAFCPVQVFDCGRNAWRKSPKKWRNAQKMVILTKESKNFIKAKLTVSKSYLLGLVCFMIFCILRGDLIQITKYLCNLSVTLKIFLPLHNLFMMLVHMEVHLKGCFLMSIP